MTSTSFNAADRLQLREHGISVEEAERQLRLFREPPGYIQLDRPCTVGDGIVKISRDEIPDLHARHADAAAAGRFVKLVPASGAASRMFRELLFFQCGEGRQVTWEDAVARAGDGDARAEALVRFVRAVKRFPFRRDLEAVLDEQGLSLDALSEMGAFGEILDALLGSPGLGYGNLAKGLLAFHGNDDESRTPFEEQLVEAASYVRDAQGKSRLHFTVAPEHRGGFVRLFESVRERYRQRYETDFDVEYSVQKPSTDTIAVDRDNRPLRDAEGRVLFRPGGHGALIENLNDMGADLVLVKNIDNVQPDRLKQDTLDWKRTLAGYLVRLQERVFDLLARLRSATPRSEILDEASGFAQRSLHVELDGFAKPTSYQAKRAFLIDRLNRPIRVCGVVPHTGEPGGGPFWVRGPSGALSLQIVETAQIDPQSKTQQEVLGRTTHFSPVDLACAVRDSTGRPFDLRRFVDPDAVIVTEKFVAGQTVRAQERPGLWNGAMSAWNTVFVEVPLTTFSPVKTVFDLLRDEHQ